MSTSVHRLSAIYKALTCFAMRKYKRNKRENKTHKYSRSVTTITISRYTSFLRQKLPMKTALKNPRYVACVFNEKSRQQRKEKPASKPQATKLKRKGKAELVTLQTRQFKECIRVKRIWVLDLNLSFCLNLDRSSSTLWKKFGLNNTYISRL